MPRPNPIHYSEPVAAEVCRRVREGQSLSVIDRDPAMPSKTTVCEWRRRLPGFAAELDKARAIHAAVAGACHRYSPELADAVCARFAAGESMTAICADPIMPPLVTLYLWLRRHPDFAARYAEARALRREAGVGGAVYSQELADAFCARVAAGETLSKACSRPGMPSMATLYAWLASRPDFLERYERARELRRAGGDAYVTWSEDAADDICRRLACGESLGEICRDPTLPDRATVQGWRRTREGFAERFDEARALAGEMIEDEMRELFNTVTPQTAAADRVRLATLNAMASRLDKKPPSRAPEELVVRFVDADGDTIPGLRI